MSDKTEAQRLADALEQGTYLLLEEREAAAALLRRWPDAGEPVARVTVPSGVTPGRVDELTVLRPLAAGEHLLYTAPPAESDRIVALEQARVALEWARDLTEVAQRSDVIDGALRAITLAIGR